MYRLILKYQKDNGKYNRDSGKEVCVKCKKYVKKDENRRT